MRKKNLHTDLRVTCEVNVAPEIRLNDGTHNDMITHQPTGTVHFNDTSIMQLLLFYLPIINKSSFFSLQRFKSFVHQTLRNPLS